MFDILSHKGHVNQNSTEIPPHPSQHGCHQENKQPQMLERMQGKGALIHDWWKCKLAYPLWKSAWRFL
jgi:hypothetical protein